MKILKMSGEMAYYHDNTAIVLSRLQCNETRPWLLFSIRNNCNKLSIFYNPLFTTKIEFTCSLKLHHQKSMWRHRLPPHTHTQSKVLPNTVREFILFMSSRFTQGQKLGPDSLMADPPFITAEPALWSRLGSHLAQRIETPLKYSIMH